MTTSIFLLLACWLIIGLHPGRAKKMYLLIEIPDDQLVTQGEPSLSESRHRAFRIMNGKDSRKQDQQRQHVLSQSNVPSNVKMSRSNVLLPDFTVASSTEKPQAPSKGDTIEQNKQIPYTSPKSNLPPNVKMSGSNVILPDFSFLLSSLTTEKSHAPFQVSTIKQRNQMPHIVHQLNLPPNKENESNETLPEYSLIVSSTTEKPQDSLKRGHRSSILGSKMQKDPERMLRPDIFGDYDDDYKEGQKKQSRTDFSVKPKKVRKYKKGHRNIVSNRVKKKRQPKRTKVIMVEDLLLRKRRGKNQHFRPLSKTVMSKSIVEQTTTESNRDYLEHKSNKRSFDNHQRHQITNDHNELHNRRKKKRTKKFHSKRFERKSKKEHNLINKLKSKHKRTHQGSANNKQQQTKKHPKGKSRKFFHDMLHEHSTRASLGTITSTGSENEMLTRASIHANAEEESGVTFTLSDDESKHGSEQKGTEENVLEYGKAKNNGKINRIGKRKDVTEESEIATHEQPVRSGTHFVSSAKNNDKMIPKRGSVTESSLFVPVHDVSDLKKRIKKHKNNHRKHPKSTDTSLKDRGVKDQGNQAMLKANIRQVKKDHPEAASHKHVKSVTTIEPEFKHTKTERNAAKQHERRRTVVGKENGKNDSGSIQINIEDEYDKKSKKENNAIKDEVEDTKITMGLKEIKQFPKNGDLKRKSIKNKMERRGAKIHQPAAQSEPLKPKNKSEAIKTGMNRRRSGAKNRLKLKETKANGHTVPTSNKMNRNALSTQGQATLGSPSTTTKISTAFEIGGVTKDHQLDYGLGDEEQAGSGQKEENAKTGGSGKTTQIMEESASSKPNKGRSTESPSRDGVSSGSNKQKCIETDMDYHGFDLKNKGGVSSAKKCQKLCQENKRCHFWTWGSSSAAGKNPQKCYMKTEKASQGKKKVKGLLSGPKVCPGKGGGKQV